MDRSIGERFEYEGTILDFRGECCRDDREDEIPIHFLKIGDIFKFLK